MRTTDSASGAINRAAKTNANGLGVRRAQNLADRSLNLLADALAARGGIDIETPSAVNVAGRISRNYLQLGAANFNAEKHKLIEARISREGAATSHKRVHGQASI
jgi:hypothetical protein